MSFEIIFTPYPPPAEIQIAQIHYSAKDLGVPISNEKEPNLSTNLHQSQLNLGEQFQFSPENSFEDKLTNPWMSIELKEIESKFNQINSLSSNIRFAFIKSKLKLDSDELETEMTLLSELGLSLQLKAELQSREREINISPVLKFKQSFNLFEDENEVEEEQTALKQAMRFVMPRRTILNSAYLNSLKINQENEIDDLSDDIEDLSDTLTSLANSKFTSKTKFSIEADFEDISAKLEFPVPGIFRDELEFKLENNLPEVLIEGESLQDKMKSTVSLKYGIAINNNAKLEIESEYNLRRSNNETLIRLVLQ
jgi:hypothetical protein